MNNNQVIEKKKFNVARTIGMTLEILVFVAALVFIILVINASANDNGRLRTVPLTNISMVTIQTDSMVGDQKDSLDVGDLVLLNAVNYEDTSKLEVGDVVAYFDQTTGIIKVHRIYSLHRDGVTVTTQGDNVESENFTGPDDPIHVEQVYGVFKTKVKGFGKAIDFLQKPAVFIFCVFLPLLMLFAWNVFALVRLIGEWLNKRKIAMAVDAGELTDELKEKALAEYLAKMQAEKGIEPTISKEERERLEKERIEKELKEKAIAEYLAEQEKKKLEEEIKQKAIAEYLAAQQEQEEEVATKGFEETPIVEEVEKPVAKTTAAKSTASKSSTNKSASTKSATAKATSKPKTTKTE